MKQRRLEHSHSSGSEISFIGDSFTRSSASVLPSGIKLEADSGNYMTGILVGFLGSPAWETRVKVVKDPSILKPHNQCSVVYLLHSQCRLAKHPYLHASNIVGAKSMSDAEQSRSISVATFDEVFASYNAKGSQKSTRSSRSLSGPSNTAISRHLSLPPLSGKEIHDILHLKRACSLKCPKPHPVFSPSSSSSNHSLRLVENPTGPEFPLPLSPAHSDAPFSLSINSPAHSIGGLDSNLHVLPPPVVDSSSEPLSSSADCYQRGSAAFHISSPYALISKVHRMPLDVSPLVYKVPRSRPVGVNESAPPVISSTETSAACQTPFFRKPLSPVTPSTDLNSPVPLVFLPLNTTRSSKIKQKSRSPSVRSRRSPPLGPSPLRTMILPDNSDSIPGFQNNAIGAGCRDFSLSGRTYYGQLGIGFPTPNTNHEQPNNPSEASQDQDTRQYAKISATTTSNNDPNILLSIIRELVEETREWDASLFMDDKFKSMIQNSGILLSEITGGKSDTEKSDLHENAMLPDHSEELDLGLIGIDVFHSEAQTSISDHNSAIQEPSRSDVKELVSSWNEGGWGNEQRNNMSVSHHIFGFKFLKVLVLESHASVHFPAILPKYSWIPGSLFLVRFDRLIYVIDPDGSQSSGC
ncbi:hypothetical protein L208DRAFT_1386984 [Tricholoma matsutake]|nr:hypothetical protein L208DRAFT_1386984 [Tricholoma matsutake 945]